MFEKTIFLLLTIVTTTLMMTGIKEVRRREMDMLQATSFNYFTCVLLGLFFSPKAHVHIFKDHNEIIPLVLFMGCSFIFIFTIMGSVTKKGGIAYMAIISKIALVIPVLFSWKYFGDSLTPLKICGIFLALISVGLINYGMNSGTAEGGRAEKKLLILLSIILFIGSGVNDSGFKYFSSQFGGTVSDEDFAIAVFTVAGSVGMLVVLFRMMRGISPIRFRNVLGGIGIGIPNFFSLVFLTKGLQKLDGTVFFPVNNIGILLLAALAGILLYKEKFNLVNLSGMGIAILSILLMVF